LKNRPHDIENPAALNLGGGFRGLPLLDFTDIEGQKREEYFSAVRDGLNRNYEPMKRVFSDVILKTLKIYGEK
jgi:cell filamentation protein